MAGVLTRSMVHRSQASRIQPSPSPTYPAGASRRVVAHFSLPVHWVRCQALAICSYRDASLGERPHDTSCKDVLALHTALRCFRRVQDPLHDAVQLIGLAVEPTLLQAFCHPAGYVPDGLIDVHIKRWEHGDGIAVCKDGLTTGRRGGIPGAARKGATRIDRTLPVDEQRTGDLGPGVLLIRQAADSVSMGGKPRARGIVGCWCEGHLQIR